MRYPGSEMAVGTVSRSRCSGSCIRSSPAVRLDQTKLDKKPASKIENQKSKNKMVRRFRWPSFAAPLCRVPLFLRSSTRCKNRRPLVAFAGAGRASHRQSRTASCSAHSRLRAVMRLTAERRMGQLLNQMKRPGSWPTGRPKKPLGRSEDFRNRDHLRSISQYQSRATLR